MYTNKWCLVCQAKSDTFWDINTDLDLVAEKRWSLEFMSKKRRLGCTSDVLLAILMMEEEWVKEEI